MLKFFAATIMLACAALPAAQAAPVELGNATGDVALAAAEPVQRVRRGKKGMGKGKGKGKGKGAKAAKKGKKGSATTIGPVTTVKRTVILNLDYDSQDLAALEFSIRKTLSTGLGAPFEGKIELAKGGFCLGAGCVRVRRQGSSTTIATIYVTGDPVTLANIDSYLAKLPADFAAKYKEYLYDFNKELGCGNLIGIRC